jgi:hypothetical protein
MPGDPSHTEFGEDLAYVNQVSQELLRVSDRARAVLLGAEIDRYLRQMLETYFLPKAPRSGRLLEGSGPVGTFTARIEVAYRLGLLRPEWHHDLQIISQIRNEFAHGPAGMTLNKQSVSDLCANLICGEKWIEHGRKLDPNAGDNPQTRFVASGVVLLAHLCIIRAQLKKVPEMWKSYRGDAVAIFGSDDLTL